MFNMNIKIRNQHIVIIYTQAFQNKNFSISLKTLLVFTLNIYFFNLVLSTEADENH